MQQELYETLESILDGASKARYEDGNLLVWVEREELQNISSGQLRLNFAKKDDVKYHESIALVKMEDGFHAYRWQDDFKDEDELDMNELKVVKEHLDHALEVGTSINS